MPTPSIDGTNPNLRSWIDSANDPASDFPVQNLPMLTFVGAPDEPPSLGAAVGDRILDVSTLIDAGHFDGVLDGEDLDYLLEEGSLAPLMSSPADVLQSFRAKLREFVLDGPPGGQQTRRLRQTALLDPADVQLLPPCFIGDYTDFYASIHHATNVGSMFRPDNPLLPNYKWVPIGYHGRASSIVPSGVEIRRPKGQTKADDAAEPTFGPCKLLDYELEMGFFIGAPNEQGSPVSIEDARNHLFGLCLVNDWSARDIQKWEYQPLGPFLAKNFATTITPYIVTLDALEPFRCQASARPHGDPRPLPYLFSERDQSRGGFDITLEVFLSSQRMREAGMAEHRVSRGSFKDMYWTIAQLIAHHTSNGCNLQTGDLLASGTISGPAADARGCLLELTWDGLDSQGKPKPRKPITLPTGETRTFLADGDEVVFRAFCERAGFRRIGFGECRGIILPSE